MMITATKKILHIFLMLLTILSSVSSVAVASMVFSTDHQLQAQAAKYKEVTINKTKAMHGSCHENVVAVPDSQPKKECCEDQCLCAQMGCHLNYLSFDHIGVSVSKEIIFSEYLHRVYLNPFKNILSPPPIA